MPSLFPPRPSYHKHQVEEGRCKCGMRQLRSGIMVKKLRKVVISCRCTCHLHDEEPPRATWKVEFANRLFAHLSLDQTMVMCDECYREQRDAERVNGIRYITRPPRRGAPSSS